MQSHGPLRSRVTSGYRRDFPHKNRSRVGWLQSLLRQWVKNMLLWKKKIQRTRKSCWKLKIWLESKKLHRWAKEWAGYNGKPRWRLGRQSVINTPGWPRNICKRTVGTEGIYPPRYKIHHQTIVAKSAWDQHWNKQIDKMGQKQVLW